METDKNIEERLIEAQIAHEQAATLKYLADAYSSLPSDDCDEINSAINALESSIKRYAWAIELNAIKKGV